MLSSEVDNIEVSILQSAPNSASLNAAARSAESEILLFLSDEVLSGEAGWLGEIARQIMRVEVGAVGARLWSPEGTLEDGGLILGVNHIAGPAFRGVPRRHPGYFNRGWLQQNVSAVSAACLAIRKEVFLQLDGFDAKHLPRNFFDIDLCLRLRERGLQVVWTPYANLVFAGSGLRGEEQSDEEARHLQKRWSRRLLRDPAYNPNLSLDPPGFTLAIPPRPNDVGPGS